MSKKNKKPKFEQGGIVSGNSYNDDKSNVIVNYGEMLVPGVFYRSKDGIIIYDKEKYNQWQDKFKPLIQQDSVLNKKQEKQLEKIIESLLKQNQSIVVKFSRILDKKIENSINIDSLDKWCEEQSKLEPKKNKVDGIRTKLSKMKKVLKNK